MIYLLHGTDRKKILSRAKALLGVMQKKRPDSEIFSVDEESFEEAQFEELLSAQGLFDRKYIIYIKDVLSADKSKKDFILDRLDQAKESENVFLVVEGKLDKKTATKVSKFTHKTEEIGTVKKSQEKFNNFALADALSAKNKKNLWVLYTKAMRAGVSPEEIHGVLFWKAKDLLLKSSARGSGNFSKEELRDLLSKLLDLYHDARSGKGGLRENMEKFLLSV